MDEAQELFKKLDKPRILPIGGVIAWQGSKGAQIESKAGRKTLGLMLIPQWGLKLKTSRLATALAGTFLAREK